ncbi:MAG: sugar ABC transporter permease [Bacilli bacterium]|jgi:multiple sugar transport system permease protein|nr:sugar ABC transporter permease [Bacilli bacterium]
MMNILNRLKIKVSNRRFKEQMAGYLFVAPVVIGFLLFTFIPLLYSIFASFHELTDFNYNPGAGNYIGWGNFQELFADPNFIKSITNTLYLMMGIPVGMVLSFVLATLINSKYCKIKKPYLIIYYLPAVSSAIAVGLVWKWLFNADYGAINQIFNTHILWLSDPRIVKITLIIKGVWGGIGGTLLLYFASMQNIPHELYEAADIEGANLFYKTFKITIPLVKQTTFYVLITSVIGGILAFADNYIIVSSSSANTIVYYLWNEMKKGNYGLVSAGSLFVFVGLLIVTLFLFKFLHVGSGRKNFSSRKLKKGARA